MKHPAVIAIFAGVVTMAIVGSRPDLVNVITPAATVAAAVIVWVYTVETQRLREAAERQVGETIESRRATYRPLLIAVIQNNSFGIRNVGLGRALVPTIEVRSGKTGELVDALRLEGSGPQEIAAGQTAEWPFSFNDHQDLKVGAALAILAHEEGEPLRILLSCRDIEGQVHRSAVTTDTTLSASIDWGTVSRDPG